MSRPPPQIHPHPFDPDPPGFQGWVSLVGLYVLIGMLWVVYSGIHLIRTLVRWCRRTSERRDP